MTHKLFSTRGLAANAVVPKAVEAKKAIKWAPIRGGEGWNEAYGKMKETIANKGAFSIEGGLSVIELGTTFTRALRQIGIAKLKSEGASNAILYAIAGEMAREPALLARVKAMDKKFLYVDSNGKVFFTNLPGKGRMPVSRLMSLMGAPFFEVKSGGVKTMVKFDGLKMHVYNTVSKNEIVLKRSEIKNAVLSMAGGREVITFDTPSGRLSFEIVGKTKADIKGWFGI